MKRIDDAANLASVDHVIDKGTDSGDRVAHPPVIALGGFVCADNVKRVGNE